MAKMCMLFKDIFVLFFWEVIKIFAAGKQIKNVRTCAAALWVFCPPSLGAGHMTESYELDCVHQLFRLWFWQHPFTTGNLLVSKWCNATFKTHSTHFNQIFIYGCTIKTLFLLVNIVTFFCGRSRTIPLTASLKQTMKSVSLFFLSITGEITI